MLNRVMRAGLQCTENRVLKAYFIWSIIRDNYLLRYMIQKKIAVIFKSFALFFHGQVSGIYELV